MGMRRNFARIDFLMTPSGKIQEIQYYDILSPHEKPL